MSNKFIKNVGLMAIAPIITQVLSFLIMPVVTRLYNPVDFGLFAIYASIIGPIGVFATMGYDSAIVIPKKDSDATNVFSLSLFFTLLISVILTLIIIFGDSLLNDLIVSFGLNELINYKWLIPVAVLFHGFYMSLRYWNIRFKGFFFISAGNISRFLTNNGILLIAGFSGLASVFYLIVGDIIAGVACLSILTISLWKDNSRLFKQHVRIRKMKEVAIRYSKFPKFIMLNNFLNQFLSQTPVYILSFYFTQSIIGFYAIGLRLLTMPINLIGNAIGEVFFQSFSKNNKDRDVLLENIFKYLVLFAIPVFSFLGIFGKEIFHVFLGEEWSEAGVYAQIITLFIFIRFITIPSSYIMLLNEKQEYSIYLNIATLTLSSISLVIGGLLKNVYLSFILYSLSNSLVYAVYGFGFMNYDSLSYHKIFKIFSRSFISCSPIILILITLKTTINTDPLQQIIICVALITLFFVIKLSSNPEFKELINQYKSKIKT